ncbi:ATP-binding cassette domain-containing protein [Mycoplasmopsis cynos]|uniref:ATP-binding cassette domain-containing protein n=1 Tax=Mycoplasmopsis cynos TaxID=171284 RepID=UPI002AFEEC32|nr:ATP-binding cassette domain-containing protein [Mycoplasmopsis cynos]WQQ15431.1 ATP-binding cassette domain-containing protein [Mycoplasmopsis cynos]
MDNKKTILEVINLKKFFVNKNHINKAVDDVSFDLKEGEIVGLIGESGSGKTTIGRSLLRLYDDYNGFVRLDGKLISGKRISRKTRKFMRKNIQMIFQDPMAALNGQNTIFSILNEPLQVNGIIKSKVKEINKNWKSVKDHFYYTFLETALKFKLQNLKIANSLNRPFNDKWNKILCNVNFDLDEQISYDDKFNSFFSYLEEKNKNNSTIINDLYTNTDDLIKLYEEYKLKLEKGEIDFDEIEYDKALEKYNEIKKLTKRTEEYYQAKSNRKKSFNSLICNISNWFEVFKSSKNSIKNVISELKNEAKLNRNEAYSSPYLDIYSYKLKLYLLNKKVKNLFNVHKRKLYYLNFDEIQRLIRELEVLSVSVFENDLNIEMKSFNSIKEYKAEIIKIIDLKFDFDFRPYINESLSRSNEFKNLFKFEFKNFIKSIKLEFSLFNKKPIDHSNELKKAENELNKAREVHKSEVKKYVNELEVRIHNLNDQINYELAISSELNDLAKINNDLFNKITKKFINHYQSTKIDVLKAKIQQLKQQKAENYKKINKYEQQLKQAQVDLKIYQTSIKDKLNTIASFDIETKYLNKDLNNTYILLGNSKLDKWLRKKPWYFQMLLDFILNPFKLWRIKKLFVKSTIYKSLEDVGLLKQFAYRYPHEFSGGQRQRIVIARALITQPKVIVADEPIASLDISIQAQVVNLLKDLCEQKNIGMIFIAHDLSMIEYIADRVQIMHLGKVVESGDTIQIYKNPLHPYTINLFKAIPKISNANEKFKDVKFELEYMKDQQYPNIPNVYAVSSEKNHFIYATAKQFNKWVNKEDDK